ncbi:hypothetical protein PUNSTDRAFT_55740 [Punctularia strigosozonata HHB-11173 SS5]|uniref:Uncharacterized protein n=1 Tax=Punctularia strigosozonata (strain HHB-11173) TaxID=741275 RepID=R7S1S5_PUNST|nr:uncharacterized protein PUNSTDRAFT_55740 [Punctularia strigosozonata HHB-11173 SS5]EIN04173.1 hypothetical protein PUNSTDRAFT_55740 [Punctularia strigosozonata HHB-11173 SS5]
MIVHRRRDGFITTGLRWIAGHPRQCTSRLRHFANPVHRWRQWIAHKLPQITGLLVQFSCQRPRTVFGLFLVIDFIL